MGEPEEHRTPMEVSGHVSVSDYTPEESEDSNSTPEVDTISEAEAAAPETTEESEEKKSKLSRKEKTLLKQKRKLQQMKLRDHRTPQGHFDNGRKGRGYKRENFNHSRRTQF